MVRERRGNIGIILLGCFMLFSLSMITMTIIEYKTLSIKRQNIHNAVVAANLACYSAIEQGDKAEILSYKPTELKNYIKKPDTILLENIKLEKIINTMSSEYFKKGERYKSIYLTGEKTYAYFSEYLQKNLNLISNASNSYTFIPKDKNNNKGDIVELAVKNFEVYNAIYEDMNNPPISNNLKNENRQYTGIHLDLNAKINKDIKTNEKVKYANVPIHIDTEITLFRPEI